MLLNKIVTIVNMLLKEYANWAMDILKQSKIHAAKNILHLIGTKLVFIKKEAIYVH
jgi:hypothetical protein